MAATSPELEAAFEGRVLGSFVEPLGKMMGFIGLNWTWDISLIMGFNGIFYTGI